MTFNEINQAIMDEMQLDPGLVTPKERMRFINDCLSEIADLHLLEKPSDISVVSGTQYVTVPTGCLKVKVLYWNGTRLDKVTSNSDFTTSGTPVAVVAEGGKFRLYPIPVTAGTLKVIFNYAPAQMTGSNGTDSPDLPASWHSLIVDYGCKRSHRKNGNITMAAMYTNDYNTNLSKKIREYVSELNSQVVAADSTPMNVTRDHFIPVE